MMLPRNSLPGRQKLLAIAVLSLTLLFPGFFTNYWKLSDEPWFWNHQRDMESFVIARIVKSNQDGVFSAGGLNGLGSSDSDGTGYFKNPFPNQYETYFDGASFTAFRTYNSQIGGQGMFYSLLDRALPFPPEHRYRVYQGIASLLSSIVLTAVVMWFCMEFGLVVAMAVLLSVAYSQWLIVFGRNLWWSVWVFYLPMVTNMFYLYSAGPTAIGRNHVIAFLSFVTVLVKCIFNGFEYMTTTLVMLAVPIVYYAYLRKIGTQRFLEKLTGAAAGAFAAIILSLFILTMQIAAVEGTVGDGIEHISRALHKRTYADAAEFHPRLTPSLDATVATVLSVYLQGAYFDGSKCGTDAKLICPRHSYQVRYSHLITLFLAMSLFLYCYRDRLSAGAPARKSVALIITTWFSVLAPISWFVVFKSHSHMHTHMNFIVWQMPFTLFGAAILGMVLRGGLANTILQVKRYSE